jgi:hypothetical protein
MQSAVPGPPSPTYKTSGLDGWVATEPTNQLQVLWIRGTSKTSSGQKKAVVMGTRQDSLLALTVLLACLGPLLRGVGPTAHCTRQAPTPTDTHNPHCYVSSCSCVACSVLPAVQLYGFRRVFAHTADIFFQRGIANAATVNTQQQPTSTAEHNASL